MEGLATMVAAIVVFLIISNFVTSSVITGKLTCASIKSNLNQILSLTRRKLKLYSHANADLNTQMTSEMGREHIGHIPNGIKTCSEPEKNLSNILTDVGSTLIKAVFLLVVAAIVKEIIATSKSNFRVNSFLTRWKLKLQSHANAEPSRELVFSGVRRDYRERPTIIGGWKHSPNLNESSVLTLHNASLLSL